MTFQHDFGRVTDKADGSIVLAELYVAFLESVIIFNWAHGVGHSPVSRTSVK